MQPRKTSWTLKEIIETDFPTRMWIVPDLLPQGFFAIGGKAKLGKSFLAFNMAIAKSTGGLFLARKLVQGRVLYLAYEDTARRFKRRIQPTIAKSIRTTNLEIEESWKPLNEGGTELLVKRLKSKHYSLCIVDPYNRAMRLKDTRDQTQTIKALEPLHELTRGNSFSFGFVLHHHKTRDGSGDPVEDIHGSIAIGSVVDNVWGFYRDRGHQNAHIKIAAKDTEVSEIEVIFDRSTLTWKLKEDFKVQPDSNQAKILEFMQSNAEDNWTREIARSLKMDAGTVSREIGELLAKGLVVKGKQKSDKSFPLFVVAPDD